MIPTASHNILRLTDNVMISPAENSVWKKLMTKTVNLKIAMTRRQLTLNLLRKLRTKKIGTNTVEHIAYREVLGRGGGDMDKRSRTTVDYIMKGKVKNSEDEVRKVRQKFERKYQYLQRRWGHYLDIMATFNTIMQAEVTREWEDGKLRSRRKIEHLEGKWGKKTKREHVGENGEWRGIKFGDEALEEVVAKDNKPLKYGGVVTSSEEDAILSLPSGFTSYESITREKVEVAAEVLVTGRATPC
jgi:hypothetical protein